MPARHYLAALQCRPACGKGRTRWPIGKRNSLLSKNAAGPWYAGLTSRHWRILWGAYLGWIFDGYEAVALVYALGPALKSILTPEQAQTPAFYVGRLIGITLLGWGIGGLLGGVAADYIGRKRMMMLSILGLRPLHRPHRFRQQLSSSCGLLRFITGLAIGSEWSTGIALVAETWPNRARPKGCGFLQSGFGGGAVLAAWCGCSERHQSDGLGKLADHVRPRRASGLRLPLSAPRAGGIGKVDEALKQQRWAATEEDAEHGDAPKQANVRSR